MGIKAIFNPKRKLNGFDKTMLVLNSIAALTLLLCYLAPVADPQRYGLIAILGLGYQVLLLLNIISLIYWLFRSVPYMLISGVCLLAGLHIAAKNWEFHFTSQPDKKASSDEIRIMTYNVHDFTSPFANKSIRKDIAKIIIAKQPDVVAIQEYTNNITDWKSINKTLTNAIQSNNHYFQAYDYTSWDSTGIAIYTRYPQVNHGAVTQPGNSKSLQAIFVDVKFKNRVFRIYTTHLQPSDFDSTEHIYLHNLPHGGKFSWHESMMICHKLKIAFQKRSVQVALIKQHMAKCPYPYIIAGDFNDTPISFSVNQISKGLKNAFIEKGSGLGITYYGDFPHLQIDYILAGPQFDILNCRILKERVSDHYPVISDMRLN
jgi:endonuclease/exonuclease/phosphatase family metal-dependent hydrolase